MREIEFSPFTWDAKLIYEQYYPTNIYGISDLCFSTLWIWRHVYNLCFGEHLGFFCLQSRYRGETYFLPPLGPSLDRLSEVINGLKAYSLKHGIPLRFRGVPRELAHALSVASDHRAKVQEDRAHFDYVYRTRDLVDLKGGKYQHKRNQIRRFAAAHAYRYHPLTSTQFPETLAVFDSWAGARFQDISVIEERTALLEAFSAYEGLLFKGGYLEVDGQMVAFTIGNKLTPNTALIHFEKTMADFSDAYAVINQAFAANAWNDTQLINREDDLGLPGLREAKSRYHPVHLMEKYIVDIP